jgi:hypothetical protein
MNFLGKGVIIPEAGIALNAGETVGVLGRPLAEVPLVILVGVTGVGKSSTLAELNGQGLSFTLLPDRRLITDQVIIAALQQQDGQLPQPVTDRRLRFQYTARYRAAFPGGMAHALGRLRVNAEGLTSPLFFDGLRGPEEVRYAAETLPLSRFVVLDAPDMVRVGRLLNRGDSFDAITLAHPTADLVAALKAIPGFEAVFSAGDSRQIAQLAASGGLTVAEVVKKVAIIVEERRYYDPDAAKTYLQQTLPSARCLVIDTVAHDQQRVAQQIIDWLPESQPGWACSGAK